MPNTLPFTITEETVEAWKKEKAQLEEEIRQRRAKLERIEHRFQGLQLLGIYENNTSLALSDAESRTAETPIADLSISKAIQSVLLRAGKPMETKEIRDSIIQAEYPEKRLGHNYAYFYTTLKRLADSGKIARVGKLYSAIRGEDNKESSSG